MTVPRHGFCALAIRCENALRRRKWVTIAFCATLIVVEGVRLVRRDKQGDFKPLHQAAVRMLGGDALYEQRAGRSYAYSPAFAFLLLPLGVLPLGAAKIVWYLISIACIVLSYRLAAKILWPDRAPPTGFYLLTLSGSLTFGHNSLLHGQSTPLMAALTLLSYLFDTQRRPWRAGACLAAAVLIKPFPVIFLAFYVMRQRWRTALAVLLVAGALLALPALYFGESYPATLREWYDVVRQQQSLYDITGHTNQSVTAFWNRLFGVERPATPPLEPTAPNVLIVLTMIAFFALSCWSAARARAPAAAAAAFALFMICWAALPPYGWKHYYFTLLLPCAVPAKLAIEDDVWGRGASWVLTLCLAIIVALHIRPPFARTLMHDVSAVFWIGVVLFGFLTAYVIRTRAAQPPGTSPANRA